MKKWLQEIMQAKTTKDFSLKGKEKCKNEKKVDT